MPRGATATATRTQSLEEVLDDFEIDLEEQADGWDGTLTEVRLAHAIMRDQEIVTPKMTERKPILFKAALINKVWCGPEAEHLQDLMAAGMIAGTREARLRAKRQAVVDNERGVDGNEDHGPLPALMEQTGEQVARQWRSALAGGAAGSMRRELQESRDEVADLRRHVGAAAPGSARKRHKLATEPEAEAGAGEGETGSED